jgi:hypothetical protein
LQLNTQTNSYDEVSPIDWSLVTIVTTFLHPCLLCHFPLSTVFGVFWTAFGFGLLDWTLVIPNGMGAILGIIQLFICLVIPSRVNESSSEIKCQVGQPVEVVTDVDVETSIPSIEEITNVVDTFAAFEK